MLDLWYQKAEFGDVWVPYLHVRKTAGEAGVPPSPLHHKELNPFAA